jgi:hypothetical protein
LAINGLTMYDYRASSSASPAKLAAPRVPISVRIFIGNERRSWAAASRGTLSLKLFSLAGPRRSLARSRVVPARSCYHAPGRGRALRRTDVDQSSRCPKRHKQMHGSTRRTGDTRNRFGRWEAFHGTRAVAHGRNCQGDRGIRQWVQATPGGVTKEALPLVTPTSSQTSWGTITAIPGLVRGTCSRFGVRVLARSRPSPPPTRDRALFVAPNRTTPRAALTKPSTYVCGSESGHRLPRGVVEWPGTAQPVFSDQTNW